MDAFTLSAGIAALAAACVSGATKEAGKDAWGKIKASLGWKKDEDVPPAAALQAEIASRIEADTALLEQVQQFYEEFRASEAKTSQAENAVAKNVINMN